MNGSLRVPRNTLTEFDRLQRQLARLLPRSRGPDSIRASSDGEFPAINIGTTPDTVEIVAFAPGIHPKAVQLSIDRGLLILAGSREPNIPDSHDNTTVNA